MGARREDSDVWHMLYRFANEETLEAWERSPERAWWLEMGRGFVRAERAAPHGHRGVVRRSGHGVGAGGDGWRGRRRRAVPPPAPPRWKQAVSIWLGFFPVNLAFALLVAAFVPAWEGVPLALRVLVTTLVLTPIMTYWVLPWVTRMLRGWLAPAA